MPSPSVRTLLESLPSRARLIELGRYFGVFIPTTGTKAEICAALARSEQIRVRSLVEWMGRDELRAACQVHGLDAESRARPELAGRLLQALGARESAPPPGLFGARVVQRGCWDRQPARARAARAGERRGCKRRR